MKLIDGKILILATAVLMLVGIASLDAQSTDQNYPTPVTTTDISGSIKARDIGDARLTSYYYQFDGAQGDLFVNIVTRNFTGDIDIFTVNGLRPLTKIVVYADLAENETGRVLYLRKPERMLLRVQGRTPSDDAASFRIKFAGSFVASTIAEPAPETDLPKVTAKNESGIRVNSVGTIVEVMPKATPTPAAETVSGNVEERQTEPTKDKAPPDPVTEEKTVEKTDETPADPPEKKVEVVVTDNLPPAKEVAPPTVGRTGRGRRRAPPKATSPADPATTPPATTATRPPARRRRGQTARPTEPTAPDPLEKVNLVIVFKDGTSMERPLSQVLRFTVDKGVLTVIAKDGSIARYSMLDVAKVTIE